MRMTWVDVLGLYLVAGIIFYGFGWVARRAWEASGKTKPIGGKWGRLAIWLGTAIGVLFWPFVLSFLLIGWRVRRRTRKMERLLGFCEHATAWEPYCRSCECDLKREEAGREEAGLRARIAMGTSIQEFEVHMDRRCRESVAAYLEAHPACPKCGKTGSLEQYLDSLWLKCSGCGRRVFTPDPSLPEEADTAPAWPEGMKIRCYYDCSDCGATYEGRPPAARADGRPLCVTCKIAHLRTQR